MDQKAIAQKIKEMARRLDLLNAEFLHAIPYDPDDDENRVVERLQEIRIEHSMLRADMEAFAKDLADEGEPG